LTAVDKPKIIKRIHWNSPIIARFPKSKNPKWGIKRKNLPLCRFLALGSWLKAGCCTCERACTERSEAKGLERENLWLKRTIIKNGYSLPRE
jgi:hypothetical protein